MFRTSYLPAAPIALAIAATTSVLTALPAVAQDDEGLPFPEGWEVRFDREGASMDDLYLVTMTPGYHVTTGPAMIAWHPDSVATGDFRIVVGDFPLRSAGAARGVRLLHRRLRPAGTGSALHLFPPSRGRRVSGEEPGGHRDAGRPRLDRPPGDRVLRHQTRGLGHGKERAHASRPQATNCASGSTASCCGAGPREGLATDGVFGLRVNHGLNLHVTTITSATVGSGRGYHRHR